MSKLIVANWKLNPSTVKEAQRLAAAFNEVKTKNKVVLCPPFVYLPLLKTKFDLGSQDIFWENSGAYTGEISGTMLKQFKVKYVIVGHSEQRALGETDQWVNEKIKAALANKITPILCVGYGLSQGEDEEQVMIDLRSQLELGLKDVQPGKVIVAYEPSWAISSGDPYALKKYPSAEHAERIAMFIRIKFKVKKVLYGGSTNAENARNYLDANVDGLLVGGASVKAQEFIKMIA